jgi:PrcB C-terminal
MGSRSRRVRCAFALGGVVLAVLAIGGSASARSEKAGATIAFRTVARAFSGGPGPKKPVAFIALKASDAGAFVRFLEPGDAARVRGVNLATHAVVAVFSGVKPTSGFTIVVQRLSVAHATLRITVAVRAPAPSANVLPAFSNPYHVVRVARRSLSASGPSAWVLVSTTGRVLARGSR